MTENQAEQLFTVTIESREPDTHQWDITARATDTLVGLIEWAVPANPACEPPRSPLTVEAVRGFIGSTFERVDVRNRVSLEPAAPGEKATLDVLEGFARRCESGAVPVEDAERHAVMSERYFRPPNGHLLLWLLAFPDVPGHVFDGIDEFAHAGVFVIFAFFFERLLVAEAVVPNLSGRVGIVLVGRDDVDNAVESFFRCSVFRVTVPEKVLIIH